MLSGVTNVQDSMEKSLRHALRVVVTALFLVVGTALPVHAAKDFDIRNDANSFLFVNGTDGNVGVNSTAPQARFDVEGSVYFGAGNVGIGTTGPRALFEVGEAASVTAGSNAAAIIKNDLVVDGKIYGDGSALTGLASGLSGLTATRVPVADSSSTVVDSVIYNVGDNVGIGTSAPREKFEVDNTAVFSSMVSNTCNGTATINWSAGNKQQLTLSGNCTTLGFTAPGGVGNFLLKIVNGGSYTITWPTIKWPGSYAPTLTSSGTDMITFFYDGTDYYGSASFDFR